MIVDERVLQPEFTPKETRHRDGELNHLSSNLRPISEDANSVDPVILYGPTGTGKTCVAKYTLTKLECVAVDVTNIYINCWASYSKYRAAYNILDALGRAIDIHRGSTPHDELTSRLLNYEQSRAVVILDEVDQLHDTSLLYHLYRAPNLSMILIANRERELFQQLEERVASRLRGTPRIHFDKYSTDAIIDILQDRVHWGLEKDVVNVDALKCIADAAAGDARVAISILRNAARHADATSVECITTDIVHQIVSEAKTEVYAKTLDQLKPDQRLIYDLVKEANEISPNKLYERYRESADDPVSDRTIRTYTRKLCDYNLIISDGRGKAKLFRANDTSP